MIDVRQTARKFFPNGKTVQETEKILIVQDEKGNEWLFYREHTGLVVIKCHSVKE